METPNNDSPTTSPKISQANTKLRSLSNSGVHNSSFGSVEKYPNLNTSNILNNNNNNNNINSSNNSTIVSSNNSNILMQSSSKIMKSESVKKNFFQNFFIEFLFE